MVLDRRLWWTNSRTKVTARDIRGAGKLAITVTTGWALLGLPECMQVHEVTYTEFVCAQTKPVNQKQSLQ